MQSPKGQKRKPYEKPVVRKLNSEQAKLLLIGHACMGHQGAKELLDLLFGQQTLQREEVFRRTN
jgi:hypothetical protein